MIFKMNLIWAIMLLSGGLVILWKSADVLVDGAVGLARRLGVSPLVIGLTIVAMGTSAPEVATSVTAAIRGIGDVAIGNVYGSNICNLALVGGLAALIRPIRIGLRTLWREIPVMVAVALLLWPILHNLFLSRLESCLLLVIFVGLILLTVYFARKEHQQNTNAQEHKSMSLQKSVLFIAIGLMGLALGAEMAVHGAVFIGKRVGLSNAVIGLTIIAIGTSLPELVTCVVAAIKSEHDISIGTIIGSNVFNALLAIGMAGLIRPFKVAGRLVGVDYGVLVAVSAGFAIITIAGRRTIGRAGGVISVCGYIAYMVYLLGYTAGM